MPLEFERRLSRLRRHPPLGGQRLRPGKAGSAAFTLNARYFVIFLESL